MTATKVALILRDLRYPDRTWQRPCLIATFGFPGTGKTTIATILSQRYPFVLLTTDAIRLRYGFANGPDTLRSMALVAETLLPKGYSVIFDGIHMMRESRTAFRAFGKTNKAPVRFIHVVADLSVVKQRLDYRSAYPKATNAEGKFVISDEHFQRIISYFESPEGEQDVIDVDTSSPTPTADEQMALLYAELDGWLGL